MTYVVIKKSLILGESLYEMMISDKLFLFSINTFLESSPSGLHKISSVFFNKGSPKEVLTFSKSPTKDSMDVVSRENKQVETF